MQNNGRKTEDADKSRNRVFRICRERARIKCIEANDEKGNEISL
jgi:hypothetical protein